MHRGTQFEFTEDFGQFKMGQIYIFCQHVSNGDRVVFVRIIDSDHAIPLRMPRTEFERALDRSVIRPCDPQVTLPKAANHALGTTIELIDTNRQKKYQKDDGKKSITKKKITKYADRIDARLKGIVSIAARIHELFEADDINAAINAAIRQEGRKLGCKLNTSRKRSHLLIYVAYGCDERALMPGYRNCGTRGNSSLIQDGTQIRKRGRRPLRGKDAGYNVDADMRQKILHGYEIHNGLGKSMTDTYNNTLRTEFDCIDVQDPRLKHSIVIQPESKPYPSIDQFRYHVQRILNQRNVLANKFGEAQIRRTHDGSHGAYSDGVALLGEGIQYDGQVLADHPLSFDGQHVLEKLHSTTGVDVACGMVFGLGGGIGAEDSASHKAMMFCAAIPKSKFARLIGATISDDEWPIIGLPAGMLGDRGPGRAKEFQVPENAPHREFARTAMGQDKGNTETSHNKETRIEGKPAPKYAQLNPIEVFRQEFYRVVAYNNSANVSSRLTPEMVADGVIPTPNGIFRFLESRGRTALRQIPFADAVRRFLTPIEVTITRDQLELNGLRYLSDELIDSGLLDYAKQHGVIKKKAYMLELCVNTLWLEDSFGKMIEVRSRPPLLEDVEFMPQTFADMLIYKERKAEVVALHAKVSKGAELGYSNRVAEMNITAELRHPPIRVETGAVSVAATRDALVTTGGRKAS